MSDRTRRALVFSVVWGVAILYVASVIDRGWGPPDEGLLGQTAERWLGGELPHRDFDDLYTGGLTAVHALAFKVLGVRLVALRVVLFVAVIMWIPLCYAVARRFAAPVLAGAVTLLAVAWSVPAYPASMPSWYNLFFATAGLLATLRFLETQRLRWLVGAGICAGLSILAKVTGIFFLGALALILAYRAIEMAAAPGRESEGSGRRRIVSLGILVALAAAVSVVWMIGARRTPGSYLQFVLPVVVLSMIVAAADRDTPRPCWADYWKPFGAVLLGLALALLPFVSVYVWNHALNDLVSGVLVLPARRVRFAWRSPSGGAIVWALPLAALAAVALRTRDRRAGVVIAGVVAVAGAVLVLLGVRHPIYGGVGGDGPVYRRVVDSVASIIPILTLTLALLLYSRTGRAMTPGRRVQAFAVVTVAALGALVGFPYSNDLYFHYIAPLICLSLLALYTMAGRRLEPRIGAAVLLFYLAFAVVRVRVRADAPLALERGGIRVPAQDSAEAATFVRTLVAHARNGYTFATPDCPEAYFLTGLKNPTRTMYEFFGDRTGRTERVLALLDKHQITAVAVSHWGAFSGPPDQRLLAALRARYPDSLVVWHFTVRWSQNGATRPAQNDFTEVGRAVLAERKP